MARQAVLYARVSSQHQRNNFSLETQLERMRQYAVEQQIVVVSELQDISTGTRTQRQGLNQALTLLTSGQANVLIVYQLDRLTRVALDNTLLRRQLQHLGVELHYAASGRQVGISVADDLADEQEAQAAEIEQRNLKERMMRGRQAKIASGRWLGNGHVPYGYRVEGQGATKALVVDGEHAEIVRLIFRLYVHGDDGTPISTRGIARKLTAMQIPTPHDIRGWSHKKRAYGEWTAQSLHPILRHKAYIGKFVHNRVQTLPDGRTRRTTPEEQTEVDVPAILEDAQLWHAAQAKLAINAQRAARRVGFEYLLAGRITCACGYHLLCGPSQRRGYHAYLYYRCAGRSGVNARACDIRNLRVDMLDAAVWGWITALLRDLDTHAAEELYQAALDQELIDQWQRQVQALEAEQVDLERQISRLLQLYARETIPVEQLDAEVARCRALLEPVKEQLAALRERTPREIYEERITILQLARADIEAEQDLTAWSFASKRAIVELLDLRVTLVRQDNSLWLQLRSLVRNDLSFYSPA